MMLISLYQSLVWGHILTGSLGLLLFWLPMLSKKGSPMHRRSGLYFTWLMYFTSLSGLVLSIAAIVAPLYFKGAWLKNGITEAQLIDYVRSFWSFLALLSLLSWVSIRQAVLVLRSDIERHLLKKLSHVLAVFALIPLGLWVLWLGVERSNPLFIGFSLLSVIAGGTTLRFIFRQNVSRMMLLREHIGSMIGCGIALYTAFAAFGGREFLQLQSFGQMLSWILPSVIGVIFTLWYQRRYQDRAKI